MKRHYSHRRPDRELSLFGAWLRNKLDHMGRKQQCVAQALKIKPQTVSQWMSGYSRPTLPMLQPLASFLGVTVEEILKRL